MTDYYVLVILSEIAAVFKQMSVHANRKSQFVFLLLRARNGHFSEVGTLRFLKFLELPGFPSLFLTAVDTPFGKDRIFHACRYFQEGSPLQSFCSGGWNKAMDETVFGNMYCLAN